MSQMPSAIFSDRLTRRAALLKAYTCGFPFVMMEGSAEIPPVQRIRGSWAAV